MKNYPIFAVLVISAVALFSLAVPAQAVEPRAASTLQRVESAVADLEIIETSIVDRESGLGVVLIKVRNKSDKAITHITIGSCGVTDCSGTIHGGLRVAAGHAYELRFHVANIIPGQPLRIEGVVYADGSIVGDEHGIKDLRDQLEREKRRNDPLQIDGASTTIAPIRKPATRID
jgi:hypothetical protein